MVLRKVFPLLLIVMILCSMIFVPASAASTYHFEGVWAFHDSINWSTDMYISVPFTVDNHFVQYSAIYWDSAEGQLWYCVSDRDEYCVYDSVLGWYNDDARMLTILTDTQLDELEWNFVSTNGVQVSSGSSGGGAGSDPSHPTPPNFATIVVVGGQVFEFTAFSNYPTVIVYLYEDGLKLVSGDDVRYWYADSSRRFLGLQLRVGGSDPDFSLNDEAF